MRYTRILEENYFVDGVEPWAACEEPSNYALWDMMSRPASRKYRDLAQDSMIGISVNTSSRFYDTVR
jgi:hypothetical protein